MASKQATKPVVRPQPDSERKRVNEAQAWVATATTELQAARTAWQSAIQNLQKAEAELKSAKVELFSKKHGA